VLPHPLPVLRLNHCRVVGDNFATGEKLDINLRLIDNEKVNEQGTLITKNALLKT
jgi:hypothetical protein